MPSILDAFPYPWHEREAQQLHLTLSQSFPTAKAALDVAERAGIQRYQLNADQATVYVWKEVLDLAATSGITRQLVDEALILLAPRSPSRPFLEDLKVDRATIPDAEPRGLDGQPNFLKDNDDVLEPEALLYRDDLTLQIGRVPSLITTLQRLVALAPGVCRVVVDVHGSGMNGTGFRIGPDLLLTNWHVLHRQSDGTRATAVTAEFGYEDDGSGGALAPTTIACDVGSIVTSRADDWAVIRARQQISNLWPILKLSEAVTPVVGTGAFIVQHPQGERKRVGFVRNQVSFVDDQVVHYLTDTQVGSSGSPVFDPEGRLIALHHAGGRPQEVLGRPPLKKNEGIRISRVVAGLANAHVDIP